MGEPDEGTERIRALGEWPAFNARVKGEVGWPLYRVYVGPDALYLIRVRWVFGLVRGGRLDLGLQGPDGCFALLLIIPIILLLGGLGWLTKRAAVRRLDAKGPAKAVGNHPTNLRVGSGEVAKSRLDPPSGTYDAPHSASWSLTLRGREPTTFYLDDDQADLKTAVEHLPRLLGKAMTVNVQPKRESEPTEGRGAER